MPTSRSIAADVVAVLQEHPDGLEMAQVIEAVRSRRPQVVSNSVRGAVYAHLEERGEGLFARRGPRKSRNVRFALKRSDAESDRSQEARPE